jgi:hypothetical protein
MPSNKNKLIAISAPVTIKAAEGDGASAPTFDVVAYNGGALDLMGWDRPVVIDLAGLTFSRSVVANLDHVSSQRVGHVTETAKADGKVNLAGVFSAATPFRDEVVNSAKAGFTWEASIEVQPQKLVEVEAGKTVKVNGQEFSGPLYVTRKGLLSGFAFVSHGADPDTAVSIAASAASQKEKTMKAEVKAWIEKEFPSVNIEAMAGDEVAKWEANYEGLHKPKEEKKPDISAGGDAISRELLERDRRDRLETITASFLGNIPGENKTREFLAGVNGIKAQAIDEKWTPERYDTELLRRTLALQSTVRAPQADGDKLTNDILSAAICQAGGLNNIEKHFKEDVLQKAHSKYKSRLKLGELIDIAARDRGYRSDTRSVTLEMQRAAFGMAAPSMQASGMSTISLPGILSDSANKFLLEGWGGGEMTWAEVSDIISVPDFKTVSQYRLGGNLKYEKVGPQGMISHGTVDETKYTNKADTYGRMFGVSEEDIINDDLRALSQVPRELGYAANDALNEVFWTLFLSNPDDFFHSDNGNVSTGTVTSATVLATIAAAEAVFFAQTKPNGTPLGIMPNVILAPNGAYRVLQAAMGSGLVVGSTGPTPNVNVFQGEYKVVRSAYLSSAAFTGNSAVKWYLLTVRPGFAVIQVAFLNGQRNPRIETASADFNQLGIQMRGVHYFGVNMLEPRAGVQGSGA